MTNKLTPISLAVLTALSASPVFSEELAPVIVSADLRETTEQDIPASVDIKTQAELQDQGATHFDDILLKTPNVNFSGQSSRARHIQIRGMGERDEYTGAPNSSVGFAVDDIDFSGIGMTGNLFDVKQVEVLRGPQNTRYGQSAIGGLINIKTNDPTPYEEGMAEISLGEDNLQELGIMTSGPINSKENAPQYRLAIFNHSSDGFRTNETLDRTDTNGRDELTLRGKMRFFPDSDTTVDITVLHADLNNGYDAWSRDNSFTTLSDQPGKDSQLSNAGSVKLESKANPNFIFTSNTGLANSDMLYSYDEDWMADTSSYDEGTYKNSKHRRSFTQDLRLISTENSKIFNQSTDWLIGAYFSHLEEENSFKERYYSLAYTETYNTDAKSDFIHNKVAVYGQLDQAINQKTKLTYSLRVERNIQDFNEQKELTGTYPASLPFSTNTDETLWGGSIHYSYKYNDQHTAFAGVTRGYKAGGFKTGTGGQGDNTEFNSETLFNYEIGLKSVYSEYNLTTSTNFFYMDRHNPQFDGYIYENGIYTFFTENLDNATNYGLESEFNWQATSRFNLYGSVGLIQTDVNGTPVSADFEVSDREQAHAPNYQINFGAKYRNTNGMYIQADITAVDKFYFDNVHSVESNSYHLVNARLGYENKDYEVYLWGKNLTDERYATRGFENFFGAPNVDSFIKLGDPRQIGITGRVYF